MIRLFRHLLSLVRTTLFLGMACVTLASTTIALGVWTVSLTTQVATLGVGLASAAVAQTKAVALAVAKTKAREKAKARLKRVLVAIPVVGIAAAAAFEYADFQEWQADHPDGDFADYSCEVAALSAEVIDEVMQELPEGSRPPRDLVLSSLPACNAPSGAVKSPG